MQSLWLDLPRAASMFPHYKTLLDDLKRVPVLDPEGLAHKGARAVGQMHVSATLDRLSSTSGIEDRKGQLSDLMLRAQYTQQSVLDGPGGSALRAMAPRMSCPVELVLPAPASLCQGATPASLSNATRRVLDDAVEATRLLLRREGSVSGNNEAGSGDGSGTIATGPGMDPWLQRLARMAGLGPRGGGVLDDAVAARMDDLGSAVGVGVGVGVGGEAGEQRRV